MADPVSMAGVSMGLNAAGSLISGMGASTTATANAQAFQYKAGIAQLNQTIAKQNAAWAINAGGIKASEYGMKAGQEIAQTKVTQAASGLDVNSGTNERVRATQGDVARFDQSQIRAEAGHQAYGYEVEAAKQGAEHDMDIAASDNALKAGKLNILSSIIGGVSSVSAKWSQGSTSGLFSSGGGSVGTFSNGGNDGSAPSWST